MESNIFNNKNLENVSRVSKEKKLLKQNYDVSQNRMFQNLLFYNDVFNLIGAKKEFICDLGSGFGVMTQAFALIFKNVDAADIFKEALEDASISNNFLNNVNYLLFDVFKDKLQKKKYNVVIARELHPLTRNYYSDKTEAIKSHQLILNDIYSSLKEDGFLIITFFRKHDNAIDVNFNIKNKYTLMFKPIDEKVGFLVSCILPEIMKRKYFWKFCYFFTYLKQILVFCKIFKGVSNVYILKKI